MLKKVLVANRSEIAIRIMRACRELGIKTIAVYSDADERALHAKYADESFYLGGTHPLESYLNINKIIKIAKEEGVDGIHPGYGFLAENPNFAYRCEREGIKFIGPSSKAIELMGNKIVAREIMQKAGVPVTPGSGKIKEVEEAREIAKQIGYPIIIKAAAGGGGIGMRIVNKEEDLEEAIKSTQKLALTTFKDKSVYLEKYIHQPRHIEIQILADNFGNIIHLGERECSIQRRHQKIIEEAPSPIMTPELRDKMGRIAIEAARAINYVNAGTIEFIYSQGQFYFLEMNTRIQVEHPVTEMVTGVDIVKEQLKIASGLPLEIKQDDIKLKGWAIECRINAEDPSNNFVPSPGRLKGYRSPGGIGIRVDSGVHTSYSIPPSYDPMISKLIVWGRDRKEAIERMRRALYEYIIFGVKTNIPFHKAVMNNETFIKGDLSTHFIEEQEHLLQEMNKIIEEESSLQQRLSTIFRQDIKVAAATAAVKAYIGNL
jgi:pyruvate carboxylase subunit A